MNEQSYPIYVIVSFIVMVLFFLLVIASSFIKRYKQKFKAILLSFAMSVIIFYLDCKIFIISTNNDLQISILIQEKIVEEWDYEFVIADSSNNYLDRLFPQLIKAK